MFKVKQKTGHGRRLGLLAKLVLLVPICVVSVAGWVLGWTLLASWTSPTTTSQHRWRATIWITDLDQPATDWFVHSSRVATSTATEVYLHCVIDTTTSLRDVLSNRPVADYRTEWRLQQVSANGAANTARVQAAFEREFGTNWQQASDPMFQRIVVPVLEFKSLFELRGTGVFRQQVRAPRIVQPIGASTPLVVEWSAHVYRKSLIERILRASVPLWVFLSVVVIVADFISGERTARRWVAMKCPQCGYERQRDRDECPECGLVYERPSSVMWDPTEDDAAPPRVDSPSPRPSPNKFSEAREGDEV